MTIGIFLSVICFLFVALLGPFTIWYAMALLFYALTMSMLIVTGLNAIVTFWLLYFMYKCHRFEFYKHYKKKVGLLIATLLAMSFMILLIIIAFNLTFCISQEEELNQGAFYVVEGRSSEGGYCSFWANGFDEMIRDPENKRSITLIYLFYNVLELTPFIAFYALENPHDCFVCLGKDPDRLYSKL